MDRWPPLAVAAVEVVVAAIVAQVAVEEALGVAQELDQAVLGNDPAGRPCLAATRVAAIVVDRLQLRPIGSEAAAAVAVGPAAVFPVGGGREGQSGVGVECSQEAPSRLLPAVDGEAAAAPQGGTPVGGERAAVDTRLVAADTLRRDAGVAVGMPAVVAVVVAAAAAAAAAVVVAAGISTDRTANTPKPVAPPG